MATAGRSASLEREVEALYEGVRVPAALRRSLESASCRPRLPSGNDIERKRPSSWAGRLRQLAKEREKLLRAYYADAIDVATLKREQNRINAEVAWAESQLATDGERIAQAKQIIDLALDLAKDCAASYRKPGPRSARCGTEHSSARSAFETTRSPTSSKEPFASLLGSHKGSMVDPWGLEPQTSWLPGMYGCDIRGCPTSTLIIAARQRRYRRNGVERLKRMAVRRSARDVRQGRRRGDGSVRSRNHSALYTCDRSCAGSRMARTL